MAILCIGSALHSLAKVLFANCYDLNRSLQLIPIASEIIEYTLQQKIFEFTNNIMYISIYTLYTGIYILDYL